MPKCRKTISITIIKETQRVKGSGGVGWLRSWERCGAYRTKGVDDFKHATDKDTKRENVKQN